MYSLSFLSSDCLIQYSRPHNLAPSLAHEVLLSWTTVPSIMMTKSVSSLWASVVSNKSYIRGYHGGCFGSILEAVSPLVLVIRTFPKWTESGFNHERSFAKMFLVNFLMSFILQSSNPKWCDNIIIYSGDCQARHQSYNLAVHSIHSCCCP